jgi:predicted HTH domain antitoxin
MTLTLENAALDGLNLTEEHWMLDLALGLFVDRQVTLGQGANVAGLSQTEFLRELGARGIPIHYDAADLLSDVETLERRGVR